VSTPPDQFDRQRGEIEFSRALAFSDGVFAIAITLLTVSIEFPKDLPATNDTEFWNALGDLGPSFLAYFLSFYVIGLLWLRHHRLFSRFTRLDGTALWLNLLLLCFVALLPLTTNVLGDHGEIAGAVALYAANITVLSLAFLALWHYCVRHRMTERQPTPAEMRRELRARLAVPAVFTLSVPIAFLVDPDIAKYFWLSLAVVGPLAARGATPD